MWVTVEAVRREVGATSALPQLILPEPVVPSPAHPSCAEVQTAEMTAATCSAIIYYCSWTEVVGKPYYFRKVEQLSSRCWAAVFEAAATAVASRYLGPSSVVELATACANLPDYFSGRARCHIAAHQVTEAVWVVWQTGIAIPHNRCCCCCTMLWQCRRLPQQGCYLQGMALWQAC